MKRVAIFGSVAAMAAAMGVVGVVPASAQLSQALQTSRQTVDEAAASQQRVDQLDSQTQNLLNDYRANLKQLEQLRRYNASQRRQLEAQDREIETLREDIDNISGLQRSVQPLMEDMLDALERFVEADLPFQMQERRDRVQRLRRIMEDPEQSAAQRYRLIVEAYQIENEYGRTIEAYRGPVDDGDQTLEAVEFLRIGRLALIYKTDNDEILRIYDEEQGGWVDLDKSFLGDVKTGLRMAKEQIPPNLLTVPVEAPEDATSAASE